MNGIIQANSNSLEDLIIRMTPNKPKRISNKKATKIVKNSVKGKNINVSQEQGFRNYIKYTDPLLKVSDETTDKSKIASDISQLLNVFKKPSKKTNNNTTNNIYNNYLQENPIQNA